MRPFIPYHGGKRSITNLITPIIKGNLKENTTYYEPFIGAGAVFLDLNYPNSVIADTNPEVINMWEQIKYNAEEVIWHFERLPNTEDYYYKIRKMDRTPYYKNYSKAFKAARYIYLCVTGYGSCRFNSKGQVNTSYFRHPERDMLHYKDDIRQAVKHLKNTKIYCQSFEKTLEQAKDGDICYLDPPYLNTDFSRYYKDKFTLEDMEKLKNCCDTLSNKNVIVILSHEQNQEVHELFKDYYITELDVLRMLHSSIKGKKMTAPEYIITNIPCMN